MRGGSVIEEARVKKLLLPTQNKERSLLKAAQPIMVYTCQNPWRPVSILGTLRC